MTEENYKYRTSQLMLRSQFPGDGKWKIPIIPRARFRDEEFHELRLIGFDRTKLENVNHLDRMVHFFYMTKNSSEYGKIRMPISRN